MTRALPWLGAALLLAGSCGTETGNPVVDVQFALQRAEVPALTLTAAFVSVERVRLRNAADCNGGAEFELDTPLALDLLAGQAPPELQQIEVVGGAYCRFEFSWHVASEPLPGAPALLEGKSIAFEGLSPAGTPFVLRSERSDDLRLDALDEAGFPISEATHALFVAFQEEVLFLDLDVDAGTVDPDGIIRIEPGSNEDLLEVFEQNLDAALRLFDDDNDNGALDADEDDADDSLAEVEL